MSLPAGWIVPQWPAPARVHAVCTTRSGGKSRAPYDSLNLGDHVGDDAQAVASNRAVFTEAIEARPVFLKQVHGFGVVRLTPGTPDDIEADGCVTTEQGVACTIMVADCLPVLFAAANGRAVAAAHAGWRGLALGDSRDILSSVWHRFREAAELDDPSQAMAWLGPCIGPEALEVGPEVRAAFETQDPAAGALFRPHKAGKWLADLAGLATRRLHALGISSIHGNDGGTQWCTVANRSSFFSHRRDRVSGRFAAAVWLS
jgi:polyphenol oxidase